MSPLPAGARWGDAALALFDAEGSTAVSAGAGSGKTTALLELVRRRLAGIGPGPPLSPREVVAITFTERAGRELVERLGRELAAGVRELRAAGDEERASRLAAALRELPSMSVGTIHGYAAALLRLHPLEASVDPDFAVLDEEGAGDLLSNAALQGAMAALDRGDGPSRRLAGALGGARALADAAMSLVRERATRGLSGAVEAVSGDAGAVDQAREALLLAAADLAALAGAATTPTGRGALAELSARFAAGDLRGLAAALRGWRAGKRDPPELAIARARLEEAARVLPLAEAELAAAPGAVALAAIVEEVERRYAGEKARAGVLDFDDLLVRARDLLRDAPGVRDEVRSRLRALLVDEYQDVNGLQAQIFDLLAPAEGGAGPPPLRVAVGDAKQSIYRFRGADVSVFASLIERLAAGAGQVVHLRENHRSCAGVVGLVNAIFGADPGSLGVPFGPEDQLRSTRSGGELPAAELLEDGGAGTGEERRAREAHALAARAAELVGAGRRPGELAVLFRRLTHVRVFERALREVGLPTRVARGGGFFQAPEVRDLGELCAVVEEPGDEVAWAALLRSPLCGLTDGSLVALSRGRLARLAELQPEDAGAELHRARGGGAPEGEGERLGRLLATWRELRAARRRIDVGELVELAVRRLDLDAALLAGPDGERRAGNLRKALALARREGARGATPGDLAGRLRRMALRPPREPEAEGAATDAVSLLTVHQAKGLEWPVVLVPDLSARPPAAPRRAVLDELGRVAAPHHPEGGDVAEETTTTSRLRGAASEAEAAESRRLLYVALTRACDRVVLTGAGGRNASGSWAELVGRAPPALLLRRPAPDRAPTPPAHPGEGAGPAVLPPRLRPAAPALPLRVAVTGLAEYARCPRRHWFVTAMHLPEPRLDGRAEDAPERATERGTLAHTLLAEVDPAAPPLERRALLAAAAARRGEDPGRPGVRRIVEEVDRFLAGPAGDRLARAARSGRLRREVPFLLRLDGEPACYLDGALDALIVNDEAVDILDYKYARHHPGAEERYRVQLAAYALAASRAFPGRPVRAAIHFLRSHLEVDITPSVAELRRLAAEAPTLAFAAVRGEGRDLSPFDLGRDDARCRAEGCGFVTRCFGAPGAATA